MNLIASKEGNDNSHRFNVSIYLALQYHRICPQGYFPEFGRKVEAFIVPFEGQFEKVNGRTEYVTNTFKDRIESDADRLVSYVDKLSGDERYKFRVLCGVNLHFYYRIKPMLIANIQQGLHGKRKMLALQLRFRYSARRVRQELEKFDRSIQRPIDDYGRTISISAIDTGDTRSLIRVIENKIKWHHE